MIKRILIPVDLSSPSLQALEYAIQFAQPFKPELVLIHVIDPISYLPPVDAYGPAVDTGAIFEALQRAGREQLARLATNLQKRHLSVRTLIEVGNPASTIVARARKLQADLIIMSTHGRNGLSHLFMGSVAERVVRTATCPVLTVRGHKASRRKPQPPSRAVAAGRRRTRRPTTAA